MWYQYLGNKRLADADKDFQKGSLLGPEFTNGEIEDCLNKNGIPYHKLDSEEIPEKVADLVNQGNVIGWFQNRMEFGPRALGSRSIVGDARSPKMREQMNLKIKFKESFRPFAPVKNGIADKNNKEEKKMFGLERLNSVRSKIPAVTHVDYSARVQTVSEDYNPLFYRMIKRFDEKYGCPVMINTSFNVRGEPIVCSPEDAFRCFMRTNMDYLIIGGCLLEKKEQKPLGKDINWLKEYELD